MRQNEARNPSNLSQTISKSKSKCVVKHSEYVCIYVQIPACSYTSHNTGFLDLVDGGESRQWNVKNKLTLNR